MAEDSYTLREVAELLGMSKQMLQRRLQEGAFPNRFLSPGRHGLETRIPAEDVRRVLEDLRRHGREQPQTTAMSVRPRPAEPVLYPDLPLDSLVATYESSPSTPLAASMLTQTDLESLRDAMLAIVREEREMFLAAVRSALNLRDREIAGLKDELGKMRDAMDGVRATVDRLERRLRTEPRPDRDLDLQEWMDALSPSPANTVDVDSILRELGELESMLGVLEGD
jgi:hypothetical protein